MPIWSPIVDFGSAKELSERNAKMDKDILSRSERRSRQAFYTSSFAGANGDFTEVPAGVTRVIRNLNDAGMWKVPDISCRDHRAQDEPESGTGELVIGPSECQAGRSRNLNLRPRGGAIPVQLSNAATCPPRYNFLEELGGGKSCARWVVDVAAAAGIDARPWLLTVVAMPKLLVRPQELVGEESRMWQRRLAGRAHSQI